MSVFTKVGTLLRGRVAVAALSLSMAGAASIVGYEGMRHVAYTDPVGVVTVCAGHTATANLGQVKTDDECYYLLKQDTLDAEAAIKRLVKQPLTQGQYDALTSFVFNVGEGNFAKSTMLRRINEGQCFAAAKEFTRWVYAKGVKLPGLVKRRAIEGQQFADGCRAA